jgi:hypothetical protein
MSNMPMDFAVYIDAQIAWAIRPSTALAGQVGNLFVMDMPDAPDAAAATYQYGGQGPIQTMGNNKLIRRPRLQVVVRDKRVDVALDRSDEIWNLLVAVKEQTINGTYYHRVVAVTEPFEIGPDSNNRERVVCDYEIWKKG